MYEGVENLEFWDRRRNQLGVFTLGLALCYLNSGRMGDSGTGERKAYKDTPYVAHDINHFCFSQSDLEKQ